MLIIISMNTYIANHVIKRHAPTLGIFILGCMACLYVHSPIPKTIFIAITIITTIYQIAIANRVSKLEKLLQQKEFELVEKAQMGSLGYLITGVANDLTNPISIIAGRSYQIRRILHSDSPLLTEKVEESLDKIDAMASNMQKILSSLSFYSSKNTYGLINVSDLIQDIIPLCMDKLCESRASIELKLQPEVKIFCQASQITHSVLHIVHLLCDTMNMKELKTIIISASSFEGVARIRLEGTSNGSKPMITGLLTDAFDIMAMSKKTIGFDLQTTSKMIKAHRGQLKIESPRAFVLEIPLAAYQEQYQA
jgi:C4-dicarboxylate-specific signal transduction histidine kinase